MIRSSLFACLGMGLLAARCGDLTADADQIVHGATTADPQFGVATTERPALPVCAPQPEPWAFNAFDDIVGLRGGQCPVVALHSDANADGSPEVTVRYDHEANTVTVRHFELGKQTGAVLTYGFDGAGRVVLAEQHAADGALAYRETRSFDAKGHLLRHETRSWAGPKHATQYATVVEQTWQGSLLMARHKVTTPGDHSESFAWTYDGAGRMTAGIRNFNDKQAAQVQWRYDSQGRPVELTRSIGVKQSMHATWSWAEGSRLVSRSAEVFLGAGGITARLDDYDAPTGSTGAGNCYGCGSGGGEGQAWADTLPAARTDCQPLPTAIGHGYPETAYAPQGDVPLDNDGVEGAPYSPYAYGGYGYYGYYGYGYGGGNGGWLGHGGPGGNWDALAVSVPHSSARFDLHYDGAGRMVREHLHVVATAGVAQPPPALLRVRTFAGPHLVDDSVLVASDTDGAPLRQLRFVRDAQGRLAQRELLAGSTVVLSDLWLRDGPLVVSQRQFGVAKLGQLLAPTAAAKPLGKLVLVEGNRIERVLDSRGHTLDLEVRQGGTGKLLSHVSRQFDHQGRMVNRTIGHQDHDPVSRESWQHDSAGRVLLRAIDYGKSGWFERHTFNAAGRPVSHEQGSDLAKGATWRQVWEYGCL